MNDTQLIGLVTSAVSNFGFPIVLTGYLLMRYEKKLDTLNGQVQQLLRILEEEGRGKE